MKGKMTKQKLKRTERKKSKLIKQHKNEWGGYCVDVCDYINN